jgi:hypothetical protein
MQTPLEDAPPRPTCWVILRKLDRGRAIWLDQVIDVAARRLFAVALIRQPIGVWPA